MDSGERIFHDGFLAIRERFLTKLRAMIPSVRAFMRDAAFGDTRNAADMGMKMHKLAGSAHTFGFPELNARAARVERVIEAEAWGELRAALEDFLSQAKEATAGTAFAPSVAPPEASAPSPQRRSAFRVLAADDDEWVRELLRIGLEKEGCALVACENGARAIEYADSVKDDPEAAPDLIVLDVNMPELDGFATLKRLQANPAWRHVPVVMLTRRDEDENVVRAMGSGAIDYVTKPFDPEIVAARVMEVLRTRRTKILIADDDAFLCDLLSRRFQRMGHTAIKAQNGAQALEKMQKERPDAVVMDVMMPGMDGIAALRHAQEDPALARTPILLLSAKSQRENVLKGGSRLAP
ncbi:MAG: response regulator [Rickettsiales bacterium]